MTIQFDGTTNVCTVGSLTVEGDLTVAGTFSKNLNLTTAQTASGASVDFTIPSGATRITIQMNNLSYVTQGNSFIQIGSGSLSTTGYVGTIISTAQGSTGYTALTTGLATLTTALAATYIIGTATLTRLSGNTWLCNSQTTSIGDSKSFMCSGVITLSGVLDKLSLVANISTFDSGTVSLLIE